MVAVLLFFPDHDMVAKTSRWTGIYRMFVCSNSGITEEEKISRNRTDASGIGSLYQKMVFQMKYKTYTMCGQKERGNDRRVHTRLHDSSPILTGSRTGSGVLATPTSGGGR